MDQNEFYDLEDRRYVSPTVSRDEQLGFINTLRDTMGQNTAQINAQTERLGAGIPSSMGGLAGSGSYFTQRYQTTPLEARANTLKSTAQAKALNDLMSNYERQMANRAQQAYRSAKRRASTSGSSGDDGIYNQGEGETGTAEYPGVMPIGSDVWGNRSVRMSPDIDTNYRIYRDANTGEILQVLNAENKPIDQDKDPYYRIMSDGMYHSTSSPEYRNAVSQAQQNKFWYDLGTTLLTPGLAIGRGIGELFSGK